MITGHALPFSIAEIARRAAAGSQLFDFAVREFLDCWQTMDEATSAMQSSRSHVMSIAFRTLIRWHLQSFWRKWT